MTVADKVEDTGEETWVAGAQAPGWEEEETLEVTWEEVLEGDQGVVRVMEVVVVLEGEDLEGGEGDSPAADTSCRPWRYPPRSTVVERSAEWRTTSDRGTPSLCATP